MYPVNLEPYANESETEQLLQLLDATEIRDNVIEKFDLGTRYKLDSSEAYYKYNLYTNYAARVIVSKTSYESVKLEVEDKKPEIAKQIADEIINQVNLKAKNLFVDKAKEQVVSIENQMRFQNIYLDSIQNILSKLRVENNLTDFKIQAKEFTKSYLKLLNKGGNSPEMEKIKETLNRLGEKGGSMKSLNEMIFNANYEYNRLFEKYQDNYKLASETVTYTNVIVEPQVSDKKSYPIRWLIVSLSVVSSLLFSILIFAFYDQRKML